jgi:hypothetical protein
MIQAFVTRLTVPQGLLYYLTLYLRHWCPLLWDVLVDDQYCQPEEEQCHLFQIARDSWYLLYSTLLRGMLALGKVKVRASMIRPLTPLPLEKKMNRPGGVLAERELRLRKATGL